MTRPTIPTYKIKRTGCEIPIIGFGSGTKWRIAKTTGENKDQFMDELTKQIVSAVDCGFNHIDTADVYRTHQEVGSGLDECCLPRNKLWVTDKYHANSSTLLNSKGPRHSLEMSLQKLHLTYIDLYLIHSPEVTLEKAGIDLKEAWRQMEELYEVGLAKNIGVSNFDVPSLQYILTFAKYPPMVNQIEFNPYLQQQSPGIIEYCKRNDILIEAYSPLVPLTGGRPGPLCDVLPALSRKYGKSEMQILLRWAIQNNVVVLTTSSRKERLEESLAIFDFELSPEDFNQITRIGRQKIFRGFFGRMYSKYDNDLYKDLK